METVSRDASSNAKEEAVFSAILTPHRSLSPRGFLILMACIGLVSFLTGVGFYMSGAWPVLGFFGLDFLLIYVAFQLNYRAARLYETVELETSALRVTRVHPSGREEAWEFNPYWVRLELEEDEQLERSELKLRSHGKELVIARFLSEDERREFAEALNGALSSTRSA